MDNTFQLLISTMNKNCLADIERMLYKNNIKSDYLIVNQMTDKYRYCDSFSEKVICVNEKGLSRSRNRLLSMSESDICLIADDDIYYYEDLEKKILNGFQQNEGYDVIAFYVERTDQYSPKKKGKKKKINIFSSLGLMSVQIAFKRESIKKENIQFDVMFGAGSGFYKDGEENIFLFDCIRKKLKILYLPITIAKTMENESTWYSGMDVDYLNSKGALFYRLFGSFSWLLQLGFAILKYKQYRDEVSFLGAINALKKGRYKYKKDREKNKGEIC